MTTNETDDGDLIAATKEQVEHAAVQTEHAETQTEHLRAQTREARLQTRLFIVSVMLSGASLVIALVALLR
jgi:hypothetical protein